MVSGLSLWAQHKDEERVGQTSNLASPTPHWRRVVAQGPLSFPVLPAQRRAKVLRPHTELAACRGPTHLHSFIPIQVFAEHPLHSRCRSRRSPWAAPPPRGPGSHLGLLGMRQELSQASAGGGAGQGALWGCPTLCTPSEPRLAYSVMPSTLQSQPQTRPRETHVRKRE